MQDRVCQSQWVLAVKPAVKKMERGFDASP
jgi:hypothetical protein